jgi:thioredoxin 1
MNYLLHEDNLKINNLQALYFYATWMPFHKKMATMIEKIEEKYKISFIAIDVDNYKNLCVRFEITSIPTILVYKDGKKIKQINGIVLTSALKSAFADICNC